MATIVRAAAFLGAVVAMRSIFSVFYFLRLHLHRPTQPLVGFRRKGKTTYALVTGASAGIGLGIAQALVRAGFNIILHGHLEGELADAAAELRKLRKDAVVKTLVLDGLTATPQEMEDLVASLSDLDVSILINNLGGVPIEVPIYRTLSNYSIAEVDAVINMNTRFIARLTALMIPILARGTSAGQESLIISMSSMSMYGSPSFVMYGATKAFDRVFSIAVGRELETDPATRHVKTLAIVPGDIRSQSNKFADTDTAPRWDHFGQNIVDKAEYAVRHNLRTISPYWVHDLMTRVYPWLPEWSKTKAVTDSMRVKKSSYEQQHAKTD